MDALRVEIEVGGAVLRQALARMARLGRRTPGPGIWSFGGDGLRVTWMGMSELIPGCASGDAVAIVGGEVMRGLARAGSAWGAQVVVQTAPGELRLDALVLGAELREAAPPQLLPLNSEPTDLLRLHVREAAERIADAGLDEAVATALARLDRSCERAAEHLGWLGVSPQELRAWLLSRYGADSAAPREIVVVEPTGQVRLFDD